MDGLGECSCYNEPHTCKAYASKPFSGWCEYENPDPEVHYLTCQVAVLLQAIVTKKDEYGVTQETEVLQGQRYFRIERNQYTNKQTVMDQGIEDEWFWGALCYSPTLGRYIFEATYNDFFESDNEFVFGNGPTWSESYDVLDPYKTIYNGQTAVKDEYFSDSIVYLVGTSKVREITVAFWAGPNEYGGWDEYDTVIDISEALSDQYTISNCMTDQNVLITASTLSRLQSKSTTTDFISSYCGYTDGGATTFQDYYDGSPVAGLYYIAPYDFPGGIPSDPTTTWVDQTKYAIAGPSDHVVGYDAVNLSMPQSSGGNIVNSCVESKTVYIEADLYYTLITYEWLQNDEIGSGTNTDFQGYEGTELDITAEFEEAKTLTWGT